MQEIAAGTQLKVSVVIPVYRVENYLEKCVESVMQQTMREIEIILVDDGSPDRSGEICDRLAGRDPRIRVLHKENGGISDARNKGVQIARADYVGFVDSDDYIERDMYQMLYELIKREQADIAVCGIWDCYADGKRSAYQDDGKSFTTDAAGAIRLVLEGKKASPSSVNKLFRRDILLRTPYPVGKTSEDAHLIIPYLDQIGKAAFDLAPKYNYIHREGTITTSAYKSSDQSIIEAYTNCRKIVREKYPELMELANFRYYWSQFYVLDKMLMTKDLQQQDEKREVIREIKANCGDILRNAYVGSARKVALRGLMVGEWVYRIFLYAYRRKHKKLMT